VSWFRRKPKVDITGTTKSRVYTDEEWETMLLDIDGYDFDRDYVHPPKVKRFVKQEDGSVYTIYGRYYISADLWQRYVRERRHPQVEHNFKMNQVFTSHLDDTGRDWATRGAVCNKCGQIREVYFAMTPERLNQDGWCRP
jgi:hypothetical protein